MTFIVTGRSLLTFHFLYSGISLLNNKTEKALCVLWIDLLIPTDKMDWSTWKALLTWREMSGLDSTKDLGCPCVVASVLLELISAVWQLDVLTKDTFRLLSFFFFGTVFQQMFFSLWYWYYWIWKRGWNGCNFFCYCLFACNIWSETFLP